MSTFKLNITYELVEMSQEDALAYAHMLLTELHIHGSCYPQVSLIREGDRSGANFLAPINDRHYKHTKISLDEYIANKPGLLEAMKNED